MKNYLWTEKPWWAPSPQFCIALIIIGAFFYLYSLHPTDETLKGALIAAFAGAWGFFLGSSSGSKTNAERADAAAVQTGKALDIAAAAIPAAGNPLVVEAPAKVEITPGDTNGQSDDPAPEGAPAGSARPAWLDPDA